jgi:hypothetical protein
MRRVAGVGLLLLVSCNQIFGLTPAKTWDASIDATIDVPHVVFTWQLATSLTSGAPDPALGYPPFGPSFAPQVRIATLSPNLTLPLAPFEHADYLTSPGMEGWIPIPRTYLGTTWRLEYTLPGGAPHEVQWAPEDKIGHLTVPMVGPVGRDPVPGGSGYKITPTNFVGAYSTPRVLTTGLWTDGLVTAPNAGSTITYDFSNAVSLSGPVGRPDTVPGARAMLVDFVTDTTPPPGNIPCTRVASGSASVDPTLQASVPTVQSVTWDRGTRPVDAPSIDKPIFDRLATYPLHGTFSPTASVVLYGAVASTAFPGLVGVPPAFTPVKLPIPAMQILVQCRYDRNPLPSAASPTALDDFPRVLHIQLVSTRQVLGAELNAGLETVIASSPAGGFKIAFPAPLATMVMLTTPTGLIDLSGPGDQIPIGRPSRFRLAFTSESGSELRADYHDVILHKIASGGLTTERIFTVTAPEVQIDGSLLAPSTDYVFEIRTYKGHAMAPLGDFVPVDYPYGAAIVFTRTFKTS